MMRRKLRFGMIGGGPGSFIGQIHRISAQMDGEAELVAGAFSGSAAASHETGRNLLLDPARVYDDYRRMAEAETVQPPGQRLDFVVIVTPNDQHYEPAKLFLDHRFNVVCEKPLALDLKEANALKRLVTQSGKVFALTHNYTGHAMVKQAREVVQSYQIGTVRKVLVEYTQGWLASAIEADGQKQARWRTDPARAGAGCIGDIGSHAENLARYITGLQIESLCADLSTFVPSRRIDDDATVMLRFRGGAKGILHCSQISLGDDNNLAIRIYGSSGSLSWRQERPDELTLADSDSRRDVLRRGLSKNAVNAMRATRLPAGHPEGYLEAFANVYREIFRAIRADLDGVPIPSDVDFPNIDDAVSGMRFIDAALRSARAGATWVHVDGDVTDKPTATRASVH